MQELGILFAFFAIFSRLFWDDVQARSKEDSPSNILKLSIQPPDEFGDIANSGIASKPPAICCGDDPHRHVFKRIDVVLPARLNSELHSLLPFLQTGK